MIPTVPRARDNNRRRQELRYDDLLKQLDLPSVRALEDFIINECIYTGIVRGKLDQKKRSLEVRGALSRDIKPQNLDEMIATFGQWCAMPAPRYRPFHQRARARASAPPRGRLLKGAPVPPKRARFRSPRRRLETSDALLGDIEEKVASAAAQAAAQAQHKELIEARADELKNKVRASDMEKGALAGAFMDAGDVDMAGPHVGSRGKRRR